MKRIKKLFSAFLFLCAALLLLAIGFYYSVTREVELSAEKLLLPENNVVLYDNLGERLTTQLLGGKREKTSYDCIPKNTALAFVDTEDKRFFTHRGFDARRIVKAVYKNVKTRSFEQGASTISQQLIKNTHLSQEKTLSRKLQEWKLTKTLEKRYSKEEILEKYLSVIYFGHNCFGLRSAANFYFGKSPEELDLADSAILAGLVKSPNNYSPFKNPQNCLRRKESVLNAMIKNGDITENEKNAAMRKPLPLSPKKSETSSHYAHFVFDELSALAEIHGFTLGGKIEISTYLEPKLQNYLEDLAKNHRETDKTFTILDANTRGFKACVSSVGAIKRSPASLIKPLLVYAPALEKNLLSPATPILDEKINYAGYAPNNFDGKFHGYVSARECVAKSFNIPAVKVLDSLGAKVGAEYLEKLGLKIEQEDVSLALALGGMKEGFYFNDVVSAYSVFPNEGAYRKAGFIKEIRIDGEQVYRHEAENEQVFSKESAYLMTDMLKTTALSGTAKKLRSLPFEIAAKTGTAGTSQGNTDAYALSYTKNDVVGVWLGNANNTPIEYTGGGLPCNLLLEINQYLHQAYKENKLSIPPFPKPKDVAFVTLDKISYYDRHILSVADEKTPSEYRFIELFKKSEIPTKTSDLFTNPSIIPPNLQYTNGKVVISFHENCPKFYQYKIDKYDYVTHTTIYFGDALSEFIDENIEPNKRYLYTVTPVYDKTHGRVIELPAVNTNENEPEIERGEILDKKWWEY